MHPIYIYRLSITLKVIALPCSGRHGGRRPWRGLQWQCIEHHGSAGQLKRNRTKYDMAYNWWNFEIINDYFFCISKKKCIFATKICVILQKIGAMIFLRTKNNVSSLNPRYFNSRHFLNIYSARSWRAMFWAARRPSPKARITVAPPRTMSPPA